MSEPKLISPMLDNFIMGDPISDHHGVRCCPAMERDTDDRYIVKVISVPATPSQMDALILSGAYSDEDSALLYFKTTTDGIVKEVDILREMSELEGFLPYRSCQVEPMESGKGYDIYLLSSYKRSLEKHFTRHSFTHLDALNLGLDLCAALAVCRRSGYLYVDLKPSNVYVSDQRLYRIGDLGFIRLDSLKYASLPEKYLSVYTAPEIRDAFSSLNTTIDIYAAGLILYQTYNGGTLPFNAEITPGSQLPAPMFADYEMSEIILKACAPNPEDRWQDPMQMGNAIVSYMQRNGASDTPIVPAPAPESVEDDVLNISQEIEQDTTATEPNNNLQADNLEEIAEDFQDSIDNTDSPSDDELDNLSFLDEDTYDEEDDSNYNAVSDEVSEILTQADELAAVDVPEPVVVPDHVDVPIPEPLPEEEDAPEKESEDIQLDSEEDSPADEISEEEIETVTEETENNKSTITAKNKNRWIWNSILALLILALLAGGFYYYKNHYLLPIDVISVEGSNDSLTVLITTDIDEALLRVICSDTYGNQITATVEDGKAVFTGLVPNTAYTIKVVASGFHRLTGKSTTAYSTPIQTNIVQFDAINGNTEGSVILNFAVEGLDCDNWSVQYSAEGEEVRSASFTSHMVNLTGLTLGKEYTFSLIPGQSLYVTGQSEIKFTPSRLIKAENLQITSYMNEMLTAVWTVPQGENVSSWSVHCSGDNYNQTIVTSGTTVTFEGIDHSVDYKVEVKAAGMSVGQSVEIPANSITATNFAVDSSDSEKLVITWDTSVEIPAEGWVLRYSVIGIETENTIICDSNAAEISPIIPNATYRIRLEEPNGNMLLNGKIEITTEFNPEFSETFNGVSVTSADLEFYMCRTPSRANWGRYDLDEDDYTTSFSVGESASFLVRSKRDAYYSNQNITTTYIIYDQSGATTFIAQDTKTWTNMWSSYNCKLEIPEMPTQAGEYTVEVYFNGGLVITQDFTITE